MPGCQPLPVPDLETGDRHVSVLSGGPGFGLPPSHAVAEMGDSQALGHRGIFEHDRHFRDYRGLVITFCLLLSVSILKPVTPREIDR